MNFSPAKLIFVFFFSLFLLNSCAKNESSQNSVKAAVQNINNENDNKSLPKDNIEELEKIIKLPLPPEEVTWRETELNAKGNDNSVSAAGKKLTVVLKYTAENADKIVEQAGKYRSAAASDVDAEDWFPAELIAQSQLSGDETLKGTAFPADDFLQTPFTGGKLTRINETDYFVLELTAS